MGKRTKAFKENKYQQKIKETVALNDSQKIFLSSLRQNALTIVIGPAGTGKTYCAASVAASMYSKGVIDSIVLSRPNVSSSKSLGFFSGSLEEKMEPWIKPFMLTLEEKLGKGAVDVGLKNGNIEIVPFETMRGRSFENSFVLLDEAQNTTKEEAKMFVTRLGNNSVTCISGDLEQSDFGQGVFNNGLGVLADMACNYTIPKTAVIEFDDEDIVRSPMCKAWILAFRDKGI